MAAPLRTAKKMLLGREIAHMIATTERFKADGNEKLSHAKAAALIETSQTRMTGLVNGTATISPGDLKMLAEELGFTDEGYINALLELRRDNHKRGAWTSGYMRAYHEDVRLLVDLERHADLLREVQSELVPGLLQCESYARAVHARSADLENSVQARLARQEVLLKDTSPQYRAVLSESCLRRIYGDATVMREQIQHLMKLSKRPNITIQILPFSVGSEGIGIQDRFILVRVPSPGAAGPLELAYLENVGEIRYVDDKKVLAQRESVWSDLTAAAQNTGDSYKYLKYVLGSYE
jgi:hypothetical protein